jgi:hypothetical protein
LSEEEAAGKSSFFDGVADVEEIKYSMGLKCHSGDIAGEAQCGSKCVLQIHTSADEIKENDDDTSVRMTPENLAAWNEWEEMDGPNMGKFSTHNVLEPRHRSYYLMVHTSAEKAADKTSHNIESDYGGMYESRLIGLTHLLHKPEDPSTGKLLYTQIRGLSGSFPAKALCKLLDVYNVHSLPVFGTTTDDFDPKLYVSSADFAVTTGLSTSPSETTQNTQVGEWTASVQISAVAATRRWGHVRCDPMEGADTSSIPVPALYAPPCLYAIDSSNMFVAALQAEFSATTQGADTSEEMLVACEHLWWYICGGGQASPPVDGSIFLALPMSIQNSLRGVTSRYCLCSGCVDPAAQLCPSPVISSEGIATDVYYNNVVAASDGCPGKLVQAACAKFLCDDVMLDAGNCGWTQKSAEEMAGGTLTVHTERIAPVDTALDTAGTSGSGQLVMPTIMEEEDVFFPPCSPTIPYTPVDDAAGVGPSVSLVEVDGVFEIGTMSGGVLRGSGTVCDISTMTVAHGSVQSGRKFDYGSMIEAVGSLGVHIAILMVPPFGLHVTAIPVFTDPGMNCLFGFENWVRRVKTSFGGYYFTPPASMVKAATGESTGWSRNPMSLMGNKAEWSVVSYSEFKSAKFGNDVQCTSVKFVSYFSGIACGASSAPTPGTLLGAGVSEVDMGAAVSGVMSGGWVVKRIDHTCMCAYSGGVMCPLYETSLNSFQVRTYMKVHSNACCGLMEEMSLHERITDDYELMDEILSQPIAEHVYDLMRLGFKDCPWFDSVTTSNSFGYFCPSGGDSAGFMEERHFPWLALGESVIGDDHYAQYVDFHAWNEDPEAAAEFFWEALKIDYTQSDERAPLDTVYEKYTNLHYWYTDTELFWHTIVSACPSELTAATVLAAGASHNWDVDVALPTVSPSAACAQASVSLHWLPVFSETEDVCSNWAEGCHFVEYLNLMSEGALGDETCLDTVSTSSDFPGADCNLPWSGFWGMTEVSAADGSVDTEMVDFWTKIFRIRKDVYFMTFASNWEATITEYTIVDSAFDCTANAADAVILSAAKGAAWAAGPYAEAPIVNLSKSHDAGQLLGNYLTWCQFVTTIASSDPFIGEGAGEYTLSCVVDTPLDKGFCAQSVAPSQLANQFAEGMYASWASQGNWEASYVWTEVETFYLAGVAMWVPYCGVSGMVGATPFCFQRASHCATSALYNSSHYCATAANVIENAVMASSSLTDFALRRDYPVSGTGKSVGSITKVLGPSWMFGLDRTFSKMAFFYASSHYWCNQGTDETAPWGDEATSACTHNVWPGGGLFMKKMASGPMGATTSEWYADSFWSSDCRYDLGHLAGDDVGVPSCFGVMPTPIDASFGCLADFSVHDAVADQPVVMEIAMMCGFHFPCVFMSDFSCASSNRDFLSYDEIDGSVTWVHGAAAKVPATTLGSYAYDSLDNLGSIPEEDALAFDIPAKGIKGFSTYGSRTCFDFETFRTLPGLSKNELYAGFGAVESYTETLAFAIRMQLYAGCIVAELASVPDDSETLNAGDDEARDLVQGLNGENPLTEGELAEGFCQEYSPPGWYVCASLPPSSPGDDVCEQEVVTVDAEPWIVLGDAERGLLNMPPWFAFLRPKSAWQEADGFPREADFCSKNEYVGGYVTCKVSDPVNANKVATSDAEGGHADVFQPLKSANSAAKKLGWGLDSMDGVIDDSFSIEYAYAGPVQHDGGYGPSKGGEGLLTEYTRVQGGKMFFPAPGPGVSGTMHDGSARQTSGQPTVDRFGYAAKVPHAGNKPVTALIFDSGVSYMHSEYRLGTTWPWVAIDTHSGVGTFCWGTQAISPLFLLEDDDDVADGDMVNGWSTSITDATIPTTGGFDLANVGLPINFDLACNEQDGTYKTTMCNMLEQSEWFPAQLTLSDTFMRTVPYKGSKLPHYKLAPSRFGNIPYGSFAVCDGQMDAYRELGSYAGTPNTGGDPQWDVDTRRCFQLGLSKANADNGWQQTVTFSENAYVTRKLPYSYDVRNGNMCLWTDKDAAFCFQDDPRTCMLAPTGQSTSDATGETTVYQWRMLSGNTTLSFGGTQYTPTAWFVQPDINDPTLYTPEPGATLSDDGTNPPDNVATPAVFLCECSHPAESLYHPPWDFVEFGALFGATSPLGWGYWGADGRTGNSAFFDHCPCGTDICGHGTTVGCQVNGYHFGLTMEVEVWHVKSTEDSCMLNWYSMALTFYIAGSSYRVPAMMSASTAVYAHDQIAKDVVGEAGMFASYKMGLTMCNSAGNWDVSACELVPANMSPYVITTGATAIKLTSTAFPDYHAPQAVDGEDPEHYPFMGTYDPTVGQYVSGWDTMPDEIHGSLIQDEVAWWTNWGACTELYAPGEAVWGSITNNMVDEFGRDWGGTLLMRAQGTSFASPKTGAVIVMILQAQLEITMVTYTGAYDLVDHCIEDVLNQATNYCDVAPRGYGANGASGVYAGLAYYLPDPSGCSEVSSDVYQEEECTLGFWHLDGVNCAGCGTYTLRAKAYYADAWVTAAADGAVEVDMGDLDAAVLNTDGATMPEVAVRMQPTVRAADTAGTPLTCFQDGDYYVGTTPCSSEEGFDYYIHNNVWRPMLQARLANRNIGFPELFDLTMGYHILYLMTYVRRTLLSVRAENGETTSGTVWYHPGGDVIRILLSPCGGGDSTEDYFPGYLTTDPPVARACCPACVMVPHKHDEHTNRCRWPAMHEDMLTAPQNNQPTGDDCQQEPGDSDCQVTVDFLTLSSIPSSTGANPAAMLLAAMAYDVMKATIMMKATELWLMSAKGRSTISLFVGHGLRDLVVTVPNKIGVCLGSHQTAYKDVVLTDYYAAADQLFPDSVAYPSGYDADSGPYGIALDGAEGLDPDISTVWTDGPGTDGLLHQLGCSESRYFAGMPWCILGTSLYKWGAGEAQNVAETANPAQGYLWQPLYMKKGTQDATTLVVALPFDDCADADCWLDFATTPHHYDDLWPFIQFWFSEASSAPDARKTEGPGATESRVNCLMRHYDFFVTILDCAVTNLLALIKADPGCGEEDITANRYQCLCRRRTRYVMVTNVPKPSVAGSSYDCSAEDNSSCTVTLGESSLSFAFDATTKATAVAIAAAKTTASTGYIYYTTSGSGSH